MNGLALSPKKIFIYLFIYSLTDFAQNDKYNKYNKTINNSV